MRVKCLAQEHNTMFPARARTRTARSGVERTNHEATAPPTVVVILPRNEFKPRLLGRPCKRRLKDFREFRALTTESQSHFDRSERVNRFIEVSVRTLRSAMDNRTNCLGLHLTVVANKQLDLSSTDRRLEKEKKSNFYCVVKISVCVTGPHDSNGLSTFLCFRRVSEGHFIPCY